MRTYEEEREDTTMTNTVKDTNKKESKLYAFFKDDNPKTLMILA